MSLSALSSSSLMALYFIFCAYTSSAGGGAGRGQAVEQDRGWAAERERVAVSGGAKGSRSVWAQAAWIRPYSPPEGKAQTLAASSLPPPGTTAHPSLTLAKPCPALPGSRPSKRSRGERDMGPAGTFYLLDHRWFSPASPRTSLQTLPGSQPAGGQRGEGELQGMTGAVQAAPHPKSAPSASLVPFSMSTPLGKATDKGPTDPHTLNQGRLIRGHPRPRHLPCCGAAIWGRVRGRGHNEVKSHRGWQTLTCTDAVPALHPLPPSVFPLEA